MLLMTLLYTDTKEKVSNRLSAKHVRGYKSVEIISRYRIEIENCFQNQQ